MPNSFFPVARGGSVRGTGVSFAIRMVLLLVSLAMVESGAQVLVATNSVWAYRKGTSEASVPMEAWRTAGFDDTTWTRGAAPFHYDTENVYTGNTALPDMRNGYTSLYLRQKLMVDGLDGIATLRLRFFCDDGFALWINGQLVTNFNKGGTDFAYNALSTASPTEPLAWVEYTLARPENWLREGPNQLAVHAFNASLTSSDFVFALELSGSAFDATPPAIRQVSPAPGTVGRLTSVTVVFSKPVVGVGFSDLLVNQRPAVGLSGGGDTYVFEIEPPAPGDVRITWDPGAGITDLSVPPNRFVPTGPGAEWSYRFVDSTAPVALEISPAPGNTVRRLDQVEVRFSEEVSGVGGSDLWVGGRPALSVAGSGAGPYVFRFEEAPAGEVTVAWAADHGIRDFAQPANFFAGGSWRYRVDPSFTYQPVRLSEILSGYGGDTGLRDEDDELPDWIELQNRGMAEVNLRGWSLSDDPAEPAKWVFPEARIAPGGFLVVFASGKDRKPVGPGARLHANFKLGTGGNYLGLFDADSPRGRVSEFAPSYPAQRNDVSYGFDAGDQLRHFAMPTPGAPNGASSIAGVLPPVDFNVRRGLFERPFELHLSSAVAGAEIRYTTDGNEPTPGTGRVYSGPISVAATTVLRAASFKPGYLPSASVTHTYIYPAQVLRQPANPPGVPDRWIDTSGRSWTADYEMDPEIVNSPAYRDRILPALKALPALSIVTRPADMFEAGTGIYPKSQGRGPAWERPASAEFIDWENGTEAQANCGIQMQGNSVRDPVKTGKHAFRLVFKGDYGAAKLKFRVFPDSPLDEFDTLTLRADFNNSWMHWNPAQRVRGMRMRDAWMKESQRAMGGLASHSRFFHLYVNGLYWGVYDAVERPDSAFVAAYLGGAKEEFDVVNEGAVVDGNMTAYSAMRALAGVETQAGYERMKQYLDVPAYIDYLLLHFYVGHEDWFTDKNWYASRRRVPGAGFLYQAWDGELILNSPTQNTTARNDQPSGLHGKMLPNPQYRLDFADRVQRHLFRGGVLTPASAVSRFDRWASSLEPAMVAECARWGDYRRDVHPYSSGPYELYTPDVHFKAEWQRLRTQYFPGRSATVLNQLKAAGLYPLNAVAPSFHADEGRVASGFALALSVPAGTVWYTTDGTDPRVPYSGATSAMATVFATPLVLDSSMVVKARTLLGGEWSALSEARFEVGPPGVTLAVSEIHYHPVDGDPYEFVEVHNYGRLPVDATGFSFQGLSFVFPPASVIAPGRVIVIASELSPGSFAPRHPGLGVFGRFAGTLSDAGERLALKDREGRPVFVLNYDDGKGWPREADGRGFSLELIDPHGDPDAPANWRASSVREGTPGSVSPPPTFLPVVRLNEVSAVDGGAEGDWIEVHNAGATAVDLAGWGLTDDSEPRRYVFPAGTVLPAGGHIVIRCRDAASSSVVGPFDAGFALAAEGETVTLSDAATNRVDAVTYGVSVAGSTIGRAGGVASWTLCEPTPGAPNVPRALAESSATSLNEWLANPRPGAADWIEIHNRDTTRPAALQGFRLATADGVARVASLSFVPPGGFLVLTADEQAGSTHLGLKLPASKGFLEWYDPVGTRLERIDYEAQSEGISMGRFPDGASTLEAFPASVSAGSANHRGRYSGPLLNEIMARNTVALLASLPGEVVAAWVELFNPSEQPVDLSGMKLGLDLEPRRAWVFPPGSGVAAREFTLVRCDPSLPPGPDSARRFNSGLALPANGGRLVLFDSIGRIVDSVEFGFQIRGRSFGRTTEGWRLLAEGSPGGPNTIPSILGGLDSVRINELLAGSLTSVDWIELYNATDQPVALQGLQLTDDPSLAGFGAWLFPPLSFVGAHDFVRVQADGRRSAGPDHAGFQLSLGGDSVLLADATGRVIDSVYFGRQQPGISIGRLPDGGPGGFQPLANPTPGLGNGTQPNTAPLILGARWSEGALALVVRGDGGFVYRLEATNDFTSWVEISSLRANESTFEMRAPSATASLARFFRISRPP